MTGVRLTCGEVLNKHNIRCRSSVGDGWADILDRLFTDLTAMGQQYIVYEITERFGGLRVSIALNVECDTDAGWHRIEDAERESKSTCEWCGYPGYLATGNAGSAKTLCAACHVKRDSEAQHD